PGCDVARGETFPDQLDDLGFPRGEGPVAAGAPAAASDPREPERTPHPLQQRPVTVFDAHLLQCREAFDGRGYVAGEPERFRLAEAAPQLTAGVHAPPARGGVLERVRCGLGIVAANQ